MSRKLPKVILICQTCAKKFEVSPYRKDTARFCSKLCVRFTDDALKKGRKVAKEKGIWNKGISSQIKLVCKTCSKEFYIDPCRRKTAKFCSHLCQRRTKKDRKRISQALKGKKKPPRTDIHRMNLGKCHKGKHLSESQKENIRKALRGKYILEKSSGWLGGKSFEPYGIDFNKNLRNKIRERDNYICQECGISESKLSRKLSVHHIDFCKTNNIDSNLISLCAKCHTKTNCNRKYWIVYYQNKMKELKLAV